MQAASSTTASSAVCERALRSSSAAKTDGEAEDRSGTVNYTCLRCCYGTERVLRSSSAVGAEWEGRGWNARAAAAVIQPAAQLPVAAGQLPQQQDSSCPWCCCCSS